MKLTLEADDRHVATSNENGNVQGQNRSDISAHVEAQDQFALGSAHSKRNTDHQGSTSPAPQEASKAINA